MLFLKYVLIAIIGYFLGNISVGILISKAFGGVDIRKYGSGNSGSTNVLRTLGWVPSVLTLIGDCLKGVIAALIGSWIAGDLGLLLGGFSAIVGHDFPVLLGFKGGKGIATSLGLIMAINPLFAVSLLLLEIIVVAITRYMSIASVVTSISYPILTAILFTKRENYVLFVIFACMVCVLSLFCHRNNIRKLIAGNENKLDFGRISRLSSKFGKNKK